MNGLDILSHILQQDEGDSKHNQATHGGAWIQGGCNWSPYWLLLVRYPLNFLKYPSSTMVCILPGQSSRNEHNTSARKLSSSEVDQIQ